jgi:HAD superfamily hydrolase (TIGR01549 family)
VKQLIATNKFKIVVFDWDATLYSSSFFELFDSLNKHVKNDFAGRFAKIYDAYFSLHKPKLVDGAIDMLKEIRKSKIVILFSNTREYRLKKELDYLGIRNIFDYIITGSGYNTYKPDASVLLSIMNENDIKPDEVLIVGNSLNDYELAKNIGAKICITHEITKYKFDDVDYYINNIRELLDVVK